MHPEIRATAKNSTSRLQSHLFQWLKTTSIRFYHPRKRFCFRVNGITLDIHARVPQTSPPDVSISQHRVLLQNHGHHIAGQLPHSQESSLLVPALPPNHQCHQLCNLLGCFATAPWTQQVQNFQGVQCCAPEPQFLFSESSSGLRCVLLAASLYA